MAVVIAVDAGTTGVRSLAVDEAGQVVGWSYRELTQHYPRPGWVEHDADEIWAAVQITLGELAGGLDEVVAAVGITNQRETVVAWDLADGAPRHQAVVWQDRRTADTCARLEAAGHLPVVRARTGLVLDPYFSATKAAWLISEGHVEVDGRLALGTVDAWVLWKLTGGACYATDVSNASRTSLFDIDELAWSEELCELFGVPLAALPEVRPSSGRFGRTVAGSGLPAGIPVSGIAGDQQAALFGQACTEVGMTKNTYGTGSFVLMNVGTERPPPVEGLLTTVAWSLDGTPGATYALEGSIFATGAAVQWLRDGLGIIPDAAASEALAGSVADSGGVYLVPAFAGLGSPWWDAGARGALVGITRGTGAAHVARATLEAIAYQTRDVVEAMSEASGHPITGLRVDGGGAANDLLLQIQANQLQVPVARPVVQETTALGAAWLAGLAEGVWDGIDDVGRQWRLDREVRPEAGRGAVDRAWEGWQRAVARALAWETS